MNQAGATNYTGIFSQFINFHDWLQILIVGFFLLGLYLWWRSIRRVNKYAGVLDKLRDTARGPADLLALAPGTYFSEFAKRFYNTESYCPSNEQIYEELHEKLSSTDVIIRFVVGSLTILGLLTTFGGMLSTINKFNAEQSAYTYSVPATVPGTSPQNSDKVQESFQRLVTSLNGILEGLVSAFHRTILALLFSIVLGFLFSLSQRKKAKVYLDLMEIFNQIIIPWYRSSQNQLEMLPNVIEHLNLTLQAGAANQTQNAQRIETALEKSSEGDNQRQQQFTATAQQIVEALQNMQESIQAHKDFSAQLVQALIALNPQGKESRPLEDLKNLFNAVYNVLQATASQDVDHFQRLEAAYKRVEDSNLRLEESQQRMEDVHKRAEAIQLDHRGILQEQINLLHHTNRHLEVPGVYLPRLETNSQGAHDTMKASARLLNEISDKITNLATITPELDLGGNGDQVVATNRLLQQQTRLLQQLLAQAERPWWKKLLLLKK